MKNSALDPGKIHNFLNIHCPEVSSLRTYRKTSKV